MKQHSSSGLQFIYAYNLTIKKGYKYTHQNSNTVISENHY